VVTFGQRIGKALFAPTGLLCAQRLDLSLDLRRNPVRRLRRMATKLG
jgi:hypothetical protein